MSDITLEQVQILANVLTLHKLDRLEFNGLVLVKSRHESTQTNQAQGVLQEPLLLDEDELLFHSTNAPALTPEQVDLLSINPPPRKTSKRK